MSQLSSVLKTIAEQKIGSPFITTLRNMLLEMTPLHHEYSRKSFASFHIDVSSVAHSFFHHLHIRAAIHPEEDLPYLLGRVLTFCHLADSTVQFSEGLFNLKLPTILATNELGNLSRWVQVGSPSAKKLKRALNLSPQPDIRVYFTNSDEVQQFTHELRGSKQNWIKEVSFLQFEDGFLELLAEEVGYCPDWAVTFIDESVYINVDNRDFHAGLTQIDIWHEYQKALRTHS